MYAFAIWAVMSFAVQPAAAPVDTCPCTPVCACGECKCNDTLAAGCKCGKACKCCDACCKGGECKCGKDCKCCAGCKCKH